jgi:hypothetical protein
LLVKYLPENVQPVMTDEYSADVNTKVLKGVLRAAPTPYIAGTIKPANSPNKYDTSDSLRKLGRGRGARKRASGFNPTGVPAKLMFEYQPREVCCARGQESRSNKKEEAFLARYE